MATLTAAVIHVHCACRVTARHFTTSTHSKQLHYTMQAMNVSDVSDVVAAAEGC
jgi:hypothetical protein